MRIIRKAARTPRKKENGQPKKFLTEKELFQMCLGEIVSDFLFEKHLTNTEFAKMIPVSRRTVASILHSKHETSYDVMKKISAAMGINTKQLYQKIFEKMEKLPAYKELEVR